MKLHIELIIPSLFHIFYTLNNLTSQITHKTAIRITKDYLQTGLRDRLTKSERDKVESGLRWKHGWGGAWADGWGRAGASPDIPEGQRCDVVVARREEREIARELGRESVVGPEIVREIMISANCARTRQRRKREARRALIWM